MEKYLQILNQRILTQIGKFFNEAWKLEVNEVSELIEINENDFVLLNVDSEIEEKELSYLDVEKIVSEN